VTKTKPHGALGDQLTKLAAVAFVLHRPGRRLKRDPMPGSPGTRTVSRVGALLDVLPFSAELVDVEVERFVLVEDQRTVTFSL